MLDGAAARLVVARRPGEDELPSGLHRAAIVTAGEVLWATFTTVPANMNPLRAVGLYGQRVAFALQPSSRQMGEGVQLWVCPAAPFDDAVAPQTTTTCDVYSAPEDASFSIGLANNDLTSLGSQLAKADYCDGVIVVRQSGSLWLVNLDTQQQDILPGTGLVNCNPSRNRAVVYRMRRIDEVMLKFEDVKLVQSSIGLIRTSSNHP